MSAPGPNPNKRRRPSKKPKTATIAAPVQAAGTPQLGSFQSTPQATRPTTPVAGESSRGFTNVRFDQFLANGQISQPTMDGIASLRPVHEFCTEVQAETLPVILTGVDVLAQAKTGTGKTLAFLIPSIELLLRSRPQPAQGQISILVLSPTRELAIQIEEAARSLLSGTNYQVQHVVGGTNMTTETKRLNNQRCDILVATPGRLLDHLNNSNVMAKLSACRALILDEADRLLEQGFRREIEKIIACLPDRRQVPRQTLLFSATVPAQVHQIAQLALLPGHQFISTLKEEDQNVHQHVPQFSLVVDMHDVFASTLAVVQSEIDLHGEATKIMAFFPTARATGLAAALFQRLNIGMEVLEIHSRKSQSARNAAAEKFKSLRKGILFSSDVTARGIDVPGVTTVLQVGLPANTEQYIHRLGRTARAGASGSGIIILAPFEAFFLRKREMAALPLKQHPLAETTLASSSPVIQQAKAAVSRAMLTVDDDSKSQYYGASLGFYKAYLRESFGDAASMVRAFNEFATSRDGLAYQGGNGQVPGLPAQTVGKMGLKGTPGLNIVAGAPGGRGGGGGGGRGGGRGGGPGVGRGGSNNNNGGNGAGRGGSNNNQNGGGGSGGGPIRGGRGGRGRGRGGP